MNTFLGAINDIKYEVIKRTKKLGKIKKERLGKNLTREQAKEIICNSPQSFNTKIVMQRQL